MVFFLWRTAAFCLLLLYRNKMQHRAFRLYLFAAAVFFRRCFSASAPKTADVFSSSKKDTASIAVRKQPSLYMYASPIPPQLVMGRFFFFNNKSHNCLQAFMLYLNILITLPVAIIFPSHNSNLFPIDRFILITDIGAQTISPGKTVPILLKFIWQW